MPKLVTPKGRVCFPELYKPTQIDGTGDFKYRVTIAFPPGTDLSELKAAAAAAAKEKWGDNVPSDLRSPFRKCSDKPDIDYGDSEIFMNLSCKNRPPVVGPNPKEELAEESGQVYGGCWGRVSCDAFAYAVSGNKGVSFGLSSFQKLEDDEPFGAHADAEAEFGDGETSLAGDDMFE